MSAQLTRGKVISLIAALPFGAVAATGRASAADDATDDSNGTKAQYKYVTKPGPGGKTCGACALFQAPSACAVVKGKILDTGYCSAFVPAGK